MAKIFLSVPVHGQPELKMVHTLYKSILSSGQHEVMLFYNENDSLISRVRNVHISEFYHNFKDFDYFMSLDSDIEIVNSFRLNNIFNKLVAHDKDFVGGLYAAKNPGATRCSSIAVDCEIPEFNSGLVEMKWLSSGCWCIKRSVVAKMIEAYPELEYVGDDNVVGKRIHGLYIPMLYDIKESDLPDEYSGPIPARKYLSEDWSFCHRWSQIGGKIFADTSIVLKHIGKTDFTLYPVEIVTRKSSQPSPPPPGFDLETK